MATDAHADHGDHGHHVTPIKTYLMVFGTLLFLTALTYAVSVFGPGMGVAAGSSLSIGIAMAVAFTKAFFVCAFFMHLMHDAKFNVFVFSSALWFALIFWFFTMADVSSRGFINEDMDNFALRQDRQAAEVVAPEAAPAGEGSAAPADKASGH